MGDIGDVVATRIGENSLVGRWSSVEAGMMCVEGVVCGGGKYENEVAMISFRRWPRQTIPWSRVAHV